MANIHWIIEKARQFPKNIYFCFIDYDKALLTVDCNKLENSSRNGNIRPLTTLPASWEICMQVKKLQSELDMKQQTASKLRKEYIRLYIVTLLI